MDAGIGVSGARDRSEGRLEASRRARASRHATVLGSDARQRPISRDTLALSGAWRQPTRRDFIVALNRNHPHVLARWGVVATRRAPGFAEITSLRLTMSNVVWIAQKALLLAAIAAEPAIRRPIGTVSAADFVEEMLHLLDQFARVSAWRDRLTK